MGKAKSKWEASDHGREKTMKKETKMKKVGERKKKERSWYCPRCL